MDNSDTTTHSIVSEFIPFETDRDRHQLVSRIPLEGAGAVAGEIAIRVNGSTYVGLAINSRPSWLTITFRSKSTGTMMFPSSFRWLARPTIVRQPLPERVHVGITADSLIFSHHHRAMVPGRWRRASGRPDRHETVSAGRSCGRVSDG